MNIDEEFDLIVIGSGPGGQKAAIQGANAGLKVALVERERQAGGTCVHHGTIPSKTLREAALTIATVRRNADVFDFKLKDNMEVSTLMRRLDVVLSSYTDFIAEYARSQGVHYFHGRAALEDTNTVSLTTLKGSKSYLKTKYVIIATGSKPRTPPDIEVDHENILDSDSILSMIYLPRSLTVVGGGVIASEYASIFSLLGVSNHVRQNASATHVHGAGMYDQVPQSLYGKRGPVYRRSPVREYPMGLRFSGGHQTGQWNGRSQATRCWSPKAVSLIRLALDWTPSELSLDVMAPYQLTTTTRRVLKIFTRLAT